MAVAADRFEKERTQEMQDGTPAWDDATRKKAAALVKAIRLVAADLRSKEMDSTDAAALAERYKIE